MEGSYSLPNGQRIQEHLDAKSRGQGEHELKGCWEELRIDFFLERYPALKHRAHPMHILQRRHLEILIAAIEGQSRR